MWGLNWVDAVAIVLLGAVVIEGIRMGVLSQLLFIGGFFVTLFVAGWLFPHLLPIHDVTLRAVVNGGLVLLAALYAGFRCLDLGQKVHWSLRIGNLRKDVRFKRFETVFGALPALVAGLVLVWLLGVAIGRLPFAGLSNSVSDARLVQALTDSLPPVPAVFAEFDRQLDPNAQPYVPLQAKPSADFSYKPDDVAAAAAKMSPSVVRITSFGCGGVISGSGFVVGRGLVATNAHVIAGVKRPIVKYAGRSYAGVPVYFDSGLDLALLRVGGLAAPAATLVPKTVSLGSTVAILGYPGGNYIVTPAIVRDTAALSMASIYDQGSFGRGIYELQATVDYGNSGGPVALADGQVAGIIFSKSTDVPDIAYALTSPHIIDAVTQTGSSTRRVSTRACLAD